MKLYRYIYRSAQTGEFVTRAYADAFPANTTRERVWFWQRPKTRPVNPEVANDPAYADSLRLIDQIRPD